MVICSTSTVTSQLALTVGSRLEVAVTVQVPALTPVTTPFSFTVATLASEVDQVTVRSVAVQGRTEAVSCSVLPRRMLSEVAES